MIDEDFKFDVFSELMHFGNRVDRNIDGMRPDEEDWYSWEATQVEGADEWQQAEIHVYGDGIYTQRFIVAWKEI